MGIRAGTISAVSVARQGVIDYVFVFGCVESRASQQFFEGFKSSSLGLFLYNLALDGKWINDLTDEKMMVS